jgi:hypothetical protein
MAFATYGDARMEHEKDWPSRIKGLLKAELKRRHVTYDGLVEKLAEIGVQDTEVNIRNKIARGGFSAVFFMQCLIAIGAHTIHLHNRLAERKR